MQSDNYRAGRDRTSRGLMIALAVLFAAVLAVLITCLILVLNKTAPAQKHTKEELAELIETVDISDKTSVSAALRAFEFYDFDSRKLSAAERVFKESYYKDLPDNTTLAKDTARIFLDRYYDQTDVSDRTSYTDALVSSYVLATGDPYAAYRTSEEYEIYDGDMEGTYVGIGVTVEYSYADGSMTVTAVTPGSPAEEAGIVPGDLIYAIDGVTVAELGYTGTVHAIRGEENTAVTVTVQRDGAELSFAMTRRAFTEETVTYRIGDDGIAYLRITQFKANTGTQFVAAMDAVTEAGARAIVFDVRANPGGYLSSVITAIDALAPKGETIVSFGGYAAPVLSSSDRQLTIPAVVLCNGYTASAGELFTAALRDYAKLSENPLDVTVIGSTTYKKGVMQTTYPLYDQSTVTLTVSVYNPPSGVNYDGVGITPDIPVENTDDGVDRQLETAYRTLAEKLGQDS